MPNLVPYSFTAIIDSDSSGANAVANQAVSVKNSYDGTLATIYEDAAGTTPIAQPGAQTDANGVLDFYVEAGRYTVESGSRTEEVVIDDGSRTILTEAEVATSKHLIIGDVVTITDRANSLWDVIAATTNNGYDVLDGTASGVSLRIKINGIITAKSYGLKGDGSTDDTAAYTSLRNYIAANPEIKCVFEEGTYLYSTSPNWAIQDATVEFVGNVTLKHTGSGSALVFDSGSGSGLTFNTKFGWGNKPFIEGNASANHGVYIRSMHHCKIGAQVTGCGTTADAFHIEFSVLGEYDFVASANQGAFISKPLRGIFLGRRNAGEDTSACIFYNPIIEGVGGTGICVDYALMNHFISGTSEGNTGTNVECSANSRNNLFDGIDLEVPANGIGIIDGGDRNQWINILNDSDFQLSSTSSRAHVQGGIYDSIDNQGDKNTFLHVNYGSATGEFSDTGTDTTITNAYDLESGTFKQNNKLRGKLQIETTVTTGAWATPSAVPGTVTKNLTVTGVQLGDIAEVAEAVDSGVNYILHARVVAADTVRVAYTQISGAAASPHPSGVDITLRINGH